MAVLGEIHRHVGGIVGIGLKAKAVLEDKIEHAGTVGIDVGPDIGAGRNEAVRLAFSEGRIGEQGRSDGLQRQAHAELGDHVGLGREIKIGLHRAGAEHHVQAHRADLGHIFAHDLIAALGHHRHIGAGPVGRKA